MKPNPKLHKERLRTSRERPDIIIAFQNFIRRNPGLGSVVSVKTEQPKRKA